MKSGVDWQGERHSGIADLLGAAEDSLRSIGAVVGQVVQYALLALVLAVWSVVGFVFWIPLMARATVAFCATAVYANLVSHGTDVPKSGLQHAVFFYVNGFRSIHRAIVGLQSTEPEVTPDFELGRFVAESLWTVVLWWIALITLGYLGLGFTGYLDQLVSPIAWTVEEVSATWAWLMLELDTLLGIGGA